MLSWGVEDGEAPREQPGQLDAAEQVERDPPVQVVVDVPAQHAGQHGRHGATQVDHGRQATSLTTRKSVSHIVTVSQSVSDSQSVS